MRGNCKCCQSPSREWLDSQLQAGATGASIVRELKARGENITPQNVSLHKARHYQPPADPEMDEAISELYRRIETEMRNSPPTLAVAYRALLGQLEALRHAKPSLDNLMKVVGLVSRLGGLSRQQTGLLAYMDRATQPGGVFTDRPTLRAVPDE